MILFLQQVGIFLVPILGLSVYALSLILIHRNRWKTSLPLPDSLWVKVFAIVSDPRRGAGPEALEALGEARATHPIAMLLRDGPRDPRLQSVYAQSFLDRLEDRLAYFPALANLATLTGLFGTVCGMITSFLALRAGGGADPSALAGGIAQALVATALGLMTAIPSLAAHAVFQKRLEGLARQLEAVLACLAAAPERESGNA